MPAATVPVVFASSARDSLHTIASSLHNSHSHAQPLRLTAAPDPSLSATSINWKVLWNALLHSSQSDIRKWVLDLPLKGCRVDSTGRLDVSQSMLPPNFTLILEDIVEKAVPPLNDLLADSLCWRGVFLMKELNDYELLTLRLARNLLLFRPAGKRELKPLSLEKFLPFAELAPYHRWLLTHVLREDEPHLEGMRKAYVTWYKLKELLKELPPPSEVKKKTVRNDASVAKSAAATPFSLLTPSAPAVTTIGKFVPGYGYIIGSSSTGQFLYGNEEESIIAVRHAENESDRKLRELIQKEISVIQLLCAREIIQQNVKKEWMRSGYQSILANGNNKQQQKSFNEWLIELQKPSVYYTTAAIIAEITSFFTPPSSKLLKPVYLLTSPQDQILLLILYFLYKNSLTRAVRVSIPLIQSNPYFMFNYLSKLVVKLACSNASNTTGIGSGQTKAKKRNQAVLVNYLKQIEVYYVELPIAVQKENIGGGGANNNANNPGASQQSQPQQKRFNPNYTFILTVLLDFSAVLQRYITVQDLYQVLAQSGIGYDGPNQLLNQQHHHQSTRDPSERIPYLPTLLWHIFLAFIRRRNTRLGLEIYDENDLETEDDTRLLEWVCEFGMKLFTIVVTTVQQQRMLQQQQQQQQQQPMMQQQQPSVNRDSSIDARLPSSTTSSTDGITLSYLLLSFHFLSHTSFTPGFGLLLKQCLPGPTSSFIQVLLWLASISGESSMQVVRRVLQLHDEGLFEGEMNVDGGDGKGKSSTTISGNTCLEHLCLLFSSSTGILLASNPSSNPTTQQPSAYDLLAAQMRSSAGQAMAQPPQQQQQQAKPTWDSTSETLLRVAYEPYTSIHAHEWKRHVRGNHLLFKTMQGQQLLAQQQMQMQQQLQGQDPHYQQHQQQQQQHHLPQQQSADEIVLTLAAGLGATPADCLYLWLKKHNMDLLTGVNAVPDLPIQEGYGISTINILFTERSAPLEHTLLRLVQAGRWYTLIKGFELFAPRNIFLYVVKFLQAFTQRRYTVARESLKIVFALLSNTYSLQQPLFGRHHFYAVICTNLEDPSARRDVYDRNLQCFLWTQGMMMRMMREGLVIGVVEGVSVGANAQAGKKSSSSNNDQAMTVPLTDYDRNYLIDLFNEILYKYGPKRSANLSTGNAAPTVDIFNTLMLNEILLCIPPTVSSSFLLNITNISSIQFRKVVNRFQPGSAYGGHHHQLHDGVVIPGSSPLLATWSDHEAYYTRRVSEASILHDFTSLLSSTDLRHERNAFIQETYKEMDLQQVDYSIRAAVWYQVSQCWWKGEYYDVHNTNSTTPTSSSNNNKEEVRQLLIPLYLALLNWLHAHHLITCEIDTIVDDTLSGNFIGLLPEKQAEENEAQIQSKLSQKKSYEFVIERVRGRIYWLMRLYSLTTPAVIEYNLNSSADIADHTARLQQQEQRRLAREADKLARRVEKEQAEEDAEVEKKLKKEQGRIERQKKVSRQQSLQAVQNGQQQQQQQQQDENDEEYDHFENEEKMDDIDIALEDDDEENNNIDDSADIPIRPLYPPLILSYTDLSTTHLASCTPSSTNGGSNTSGISNGCERFSSLHPSQYLPWNGSPLLNPTNIVSDAMRAQHAAQIAADEDLDLTRLSPQEIRLLSEYSVDTRLVLVLVESLLHKLQLTTAFSLLSDILTRFPSIRYTSRIQSAIVLCDTFSLLLWISHPKLNSEVRINTVLAADSYDLPFAGGRSKPRDEKTDPFVAFYKEFLSIPSLPHLRSDESASWSQKMRWNTSLSDLDSITLVLERLLVNAPRKLYGGVLGKMVVQKKANVDSPSASSASSSANSPSHSSSSNGGTSFFGRMKSLSDVFKSSGSQLGSNDQQVSSELADLDVEQLRTQLLAMNEEKRAEMLERFVELITRAASSSSSSNSSSARPQGMTTLALSSAELLRDSFNSSFHASTRRHIPVLIEFAQYLSTSIRVAYEAALPRNKRVIVAMTDGMRVTPLLFLNTLVSLGVRSCVMSSTWPTQIRSIRDLTTLQPPTEAGTPTYPWLHAIAKRLNRSLLDLLCMIPSELIYTLWYSNTNERPSIYSLLHTHQLSYHYINHSTQTYLPSQVTQRDYARSFVETFLYEQQELEKLSGTPNLFNKFQSRSHSNHWWSRSRYELFFTSVDHNILNYTILALGFRAEALLRIRARDKESGITSLILEENKNSGLIGWWNGEHENLSAILSVTSEEYLRLTPHTMVEYELLHASAQCYSLASRRFEQKQVLNDIKSGIKACWTHVSAKSKHPAPPIITNTQDMNESVTPPFPGASHEQIESVCLARVQLERSAEMCYPAEMKEFIVQQWRQFKKKAPQTFA